MQHSERIVTFGQSCVGKTTFAKQLSTHSYCCFDALFNWHMLAALGLSYERALEHVGSQCTGKFVLDGWHLADPTGSLLPTNTTIYVIYADYAQIIKQYRVQVDYFEQYRDMFHKWYYEIDYPSLPCRYFRSMGEGLFKEEDIKEFTVFLERNRQIAS